MQFIQDREWYRVIRITGPAHNLLALDLGGRGDPNVIVEALPGRRGEAPHISADEVRRYVLEGVSEANESFGTHYRVDRIQFVPTDSPPAEIYRSLARSVVERLIRKEPFVQPPKKEV